jgi:hypothetical protein
MLKLVLDFGLVKEALTQFGIQRQFGEDRFNGNDLIGDSVHGTVDHPHTAVRDLFSGAVAGHLFRQQVRPPPSASPACGVAWKG